MRIIDSLPDHEHKLCKLVLVEDDDGKFKVLSQAANRKIRCAKDHLNRDDSLAFWQAACTAHYFSVTHSSSDAWALARRRMDSVTETIH